MFATQDRAASGYLIRAGEMSLWMDAGGGSWRNLLGYIDYEELDGIVLSHRHPDHTVDVFQALHARGFGGPEPLPAIPLWANAETLERVNAYATDVDVIFDLREVTAGSSIEIEKLRFSFFQMQHWCDTYGMRIEDPDGVLAYSSDTALEADFGGLAHDADVFLCEATKQDHDPVSDGHLRASEAAALAAQFGVAHLVLTHLPPGRDLGLTLAEAHKTAQGTALELADDGNVYEVGG
jgi:ribonuclease BN (tRNA processing enzyme)